MDLPSADLAVVMNQAARMSDWATMRALAKQGVGPTDGDALWACLSRHQHELLEMLLPLASQAARDEAVRRVSHSLHIPGQDILLRYPMSLAAWQAAIKGFSRQLNLDALQSLAQHPHGLDDHTVSVAMLTVTPIVHSYPVPDQAIAVLQHLASQWPIENIVRALLPEERWADLDALATCDWPLEVLEEVVQTTTPNLVPRVHRQFEAKKLAQVLGDARAAPTRPNRL
jgi:hypothetical protein